MNHSLHFIVCGPTLTAVGLNMALRSAPQRDKITLSSAPPFNQVPTLLIISNPSKTTFSLFS